MAQNCTSNLTLRNIFSIHTEGRRWRKKRWREGGRKKKWRNGGIEGEGEGGRRDGGGEGERKKGQRKEGVSERVYIAMKLSPVCSLAHCF